MNYSVPSEYKPITAWGYVGYTILYSIPLLGTIILIVNAIGANNINVRNYSRSFFCTLLLAIIAIIVLIILVAMGIIHISFDFFRYL